MTYILIILLIILIIVTLLNLTTKNPETAAQLSEVLNGIGLAAQGLMVITVISLGYFLILNFYEYILIGF